MSRLVFLKIFYFLFGLLFFVCYFFRGQYFKHVLKINESSFGAFAACSSLIGVCTNVLVSLFADKFRVHTVLLVVLSILSSAAFGFILVYHEHFSTHHFQAILLMGLYVLFASAMWPLVDRIVLQTLSRMNYSKDYFSSQRLFGNVGYFVVTLGIGHLVTVLGYTKGLMLGISVICPSFIIYLLLWHFGIFDLIWGNTENPNPFKAEEKPQPSKSHEAIFPSEFPDRPSDITALLSLSAYQIYLLCLLVDGFTRFVLGFFLNLYFTEEVGMSPRQASATVSFGIIVEMVFYSVGAPLLRTLGVYPMFALGQIIMAIRLWTLFFVPSSSRYEVFVLIELSRGVIGGLIHPASVALASNLSPKGKESTCQAIFNGVYTGIGGFIAGFFGSYCLSVKSNIFNISAFRFMLLLVAIISSTWCLFYILLYRNWIKKSLERNSQNDQNDQNMPIAKPILNGQNNYT